MLRQSKTFHHHDGFIFIFIFKIPIFKDRKHGILHSCASWILHAIKSIISCFKCFYFIHYRQLKDSNFKITVFSRCILGFSLLISKEICLNKPALYLKSSLFITLVSGEIRKFNPSLKRAGCIFHKGWCLCIQCSVSVFNHCTKGSQITVEFLNEPVRFVLKVKWICQKQKTIKRTSDIFVRPKEDGMGRLTRCRTHTKPQMKNEKSVNQAAEGTNGEECFRGIVSCATWDKFQLQSYKFECESLYKGSINSVKD